METWTPTAVLRYLIKRDSRSFYLQQQWVSSSGKTEWRGIPTENQKDGEQ